MEGRRDWGREKVKGLIGASCEMKEGDCRGLCCFDLVSFPVYVPTSFLEKSSLLLLQLLRLLLQPSVSFLLFFAFFFPLVCQ